MLRRDRLHWLILAGLLALGLPAMSRSMERDFPLLAVARGKETLTERHARVRGYYENLIRSRYRNPPADWFGLLESPQFAILSKDTFPRYVLRPDASGIYKGSDFSTNSAGFRDQEYAIEPPPRTLRIVILGSSHAMGSGVADDEVFEAVLERRLNRDLSPKTGQRYELLNFSIAGDSMLEHVLTIERALAFKPHVVMFIMTPWEAERVKTILKGLTHTPPKHGLYDALVKFVAANRRASPAEFAAAADDMLNRTLARLAARACQTGTRPLWVRIPFPDTTPHTLAAPAPYLDVDVTAAYDEVDVPTDLWIREWDDHPKAEGHAMLADHMFPALIALDRRVPFGLADLGRRTPCPPANQETN